MNNPEFKIEEICVAGQSGSNGHEQAGPDSSTPRSPISGNTSGRVTTLPYSLRSMRAQAEIYAITRALEEAGWNRKRAAQMLRISYRGLLYKISSHKITRQNGKSQPVGAEAAAFASNQIK